MPRGQEITDTAEFFERSASQRQQCTDDAEAMLVHSLRKSEDSGYETLVRSYGPQVMAIARRYLRSEVDAADCFQDTFIAVYQSIERFQQRSSFRQWVRGVAVKQCLMRLRRRPRQRQESIEHTLPMFDDRGSRVDMSNPRQKSAIDELLDAEKMRAVVRESIDKLPEDYRLLLLLRDIDGYSTSEAATILGIKLSATKTRLHRARSALKYILEPILGQTGCYVDM